MLKAIAIQMSDCCEELNTQIKRMSSLSWEIESVIKNLSLLSDMDVVMEEVRKKGENLDEENVELIQMKQALGNIRAMYVTCENRVLDEYEQSGIMWRQEMLGYCDLKPVSQILRRLDFII